MHKQVEVQSDRMRMLQGTALALGAEMDKKEMAAVGETTAVIVCCDSARQCSRHISSAEKCDILACMSFSMLQDRMTRAEVAHPHLQPTRCHTNNPSAKKYSLK